MTKEAAPELGFDDKLVFQLSRAERQNAFLNGGILEVMICRIVIKVHGRYSHDTLTKLCS